MGIDWQVLLVLAQPDAKALSAEPAFKPSRKTALSRQQFVKDQALLACYHVTKRGLEALEHLNLLETRLSAKELLTILTLIREIPKPK